MATRKRRSGAVRTTADEGELDGSRALDENIDAIKAWQRASGHKRTHVEQLSDQITKLFAGGPALLFHVVWFAFWILANLEWIPGVRAFDPFPFQLLTMTVSLEAIFLALFVLASQNRLARQADKRSHLDLQIDLLAEREMTTVLRLLEDIAQHLQVNTSVTDAQLRDLAANTDVQRLTSRMEEFSEAQQDDPHRPSAAAKPPPR